jgi:replication factor A1
MVVTLWGEFAKTEDKKFEGNPVLGIKSVLIKEFNGGRTGGTLDRSGLVFEPEGAVADRVRGWWKEGGSSQNLKTISSLGGGGGARARNAKHCELAAFRTAVENVAEQAEHFCIVSRLALVQTRKQGEQVPLYYRACGEPKEGTTLLCNRRVDEAGYCASCSRNSAKTNLRLTLRCRFSDFRDSVWLTTFHEAAEQVISMTVEDVDAIDTKANGRDQLEAQVKQCYFSEPLQVTVRANLQTYNGEPRVNMSCVDARVVNRKEHGRVLLQEIQQMLGA